ncbi:MAG: right-handed parallel beta-helix repeat-containing protein [Calditrichaeota bacterium]|nr:right-handed parallel beta-helix repeat-containing protein [Calditrichota bacterium]
MKRSLFIVLSLLLVYFILNQTTFARIIHVPDDIRVLQTAVNRASEGDSIIVEPGDYPHITIREKDNLTLIGAGLDAERMSTIFGVPNTHSEVALNAIRCNNLEIKGFEFTEGYTAVWLQSCDNVWVHENYIHDLPSWWSSSISVSSTDNLMIERNIMLRSWHYGVYIDGNILGPTCDNIIVRNNVIGWMVNNDGIYLEDVDGIDIYNNIIVQNGDIGINNCRQVRNMRVEYNCLFRNDNGNHRGFNLSRTNMIDDPEFVNQRRDDYLLANNSPCIDAGDPDSPRDPDDSRADIGVYPIPEAEEEAPELSYFEFTETDVSHRLIIRSARFDDEELDEGDEIGVFTPNELCAGAVIWDGDVTRLQAWMNDADTDEIDGFLEGERIYVHIWRNEEDREYRAKREWIQGSNYFNPNTSSTLEIEAFSSVECTIEMQRGWNIISANVEPFTRDIFEIFEQLTELVDNPLVIVKDGNGNFYFPDWDHFSNMGDWVCWGAYMVFVTRDVELTIEGDYIEPDHPLELRRGIQLITYLPAWEIEAEDAFESIVDNLFLVRDGSGNFYVPRYNFNCMDLLSPGHGYLVWMVADDQLIYPGEEPQDNNRMNDDEINSSDKSSLLSDNMSLLVMGSKLRSGDKVIALNNYNEIVGEGLVNDKGYCGFALWGKSEYTSNEMGLSDDEVPLYKVIRGTVCIDASLKIKEGSARYKDNSFILGELVFSHNSSVKSFMLLEPYPNPFNSRSTVAFNLAISAMVQLDLIDLNGKLIKKLVNGVFSAGHHSVNFNADGLSSGVYLLRLTSINGIAVRKVLLVR